MKIDFYILPQTLDQYWWTLVSLGLLSSDFFRGAVSRTYRLWKAVLFQMFGENDLYVAPHLEAIVPC